MKFKLIHYSKGKKLRALLVTFTLVNTLLLSQVVVASYYMASTQLISLNNIMLAESSACKSCIRTYACDHFNKICQKNCLANLYTSDADLESCSVSCTSDWRKCQINAKKSCGSYYCSSENN